MQTKTKRILLSASLAFCCSITGWAQDVVVDFAKEGTADGNSQTLRKGGTVSFDFTGSNSEPLGAKFYNTWDSYSMTIASTRNIAVIEYQTVAKSGKTDNLSASIGDLNKKDADTWVWKGNASQIKFVGGSSSTSCSVTRLRLWYNLADYDPNTPWDGGDTYNPYAAVVDLAEDDTDYTQRDRVFASANILPRDGRGVPMAVVSDRKFQTTLKSYLDWKTQQGYEVQELYTDEIPGGKKGTELAHAIREKLMAMEPRPAYVLLVGDIEEIPSFPGIGAADLYYGEYTDDYYPEAYVGRFSANEVYQLKPQLEKTRYMATLDPKNGEWLKHSLTIDNITSEINVMDPASDLSLYYPLNFEGNTSERTNTDYSPSINNIINNGCSYVSYFGHGGPGLWNGAYSNDYVSQLNNTGKYPVVFSITCHAGNFAYNLQPCLAEAFMQRQDAGAVAVIAASRPSRCDSNYRLFFGDPGGNQSASVGLLRSLFPCVGTDPSQRARTIGQALEVGMVGVARKIRDDDFYENTEMYNLLGDPTYQPYITTPKANKLRPSSTNITAGRSVTVSTVPDAMVALSQGRTVIAAAMADADGKVTLRVPATAPTGVCTLYTSAPGYNDLSQTITLAAGDGTEEVADEAAALAGITHTDVISLKTAGDAVTNEWVGEQNIVSTTSSARYRICAVNDKSSFADGVKGNKHWLDSEAPAEGIYMRNNYNFCSIVTTTSPGKARRVTIDWLHPTGQGEVIGVYGSNTAYSSTTDAWNGNGWNGNANGTKLGELVKGYNDELIIGGDYKYLLFRAEPHKQFPTGEQSNVFIRSLSIDWEAELPQCDTPEIAFADGEISLSCTTKGATFDYGIAPSKTKKGVFVLTATATASGYAPSAQASLEIDASALATVRGDIDENGVISITDITKLIKSLTPQTK